ncbi:MAG: hypothetical protein ACYTHJ_04610 [Planctomycetota bacterium]|jgi:hypothetical protein
MEQVKLFSMTGILSVLIWASADTLVSESTRIKVAVDLISPDADTKIDQESGDRSVTINITGPRKAVNAARSKTPVSVKFPVGEQPTGRSTIALDPVVLKRYLTEQHEEFATLSITRVEPPSIPAVIDHLVTKEVRIVARRLETAFEAPPQILISKAEVKLRESEFAEKTEGKNALVADISAEIDRYFKDKPQGEPSSHDVAISDPSFGADAVFFPPQVKVQGIVKSQEVEADISSVPVLLAVSFQNFEKAYRPIGADGRALQIVKPPIKVKGLPDAIASLVRGDTRAYGIIQLKEDDLRIQNNTIAFEPVYHLPSGITLVDDRVQVEFRLEDAVANPASN